MERSKLAKFQDEIISIDGVMSYHKLSYMTSKFDDVTSLSKMSVLL